MVLSIAFAAAAGPLYESCQRVAADSRPAEYLRAVLQP